jgi:hypothetical protein
MDNKPPGIRRLCLAFGIEPPATGRDDDAAAAEEQVVAAFSSVCASLGLDRMLMNRRETGDEQVALLPVGIDEPRVVSSLVDGLSRALAELNAAPPRAASLRIRLAFHEGVTTLAGDRFAGAALAWVGRLVGDWHLRAALTKHPRASLAVLLSDPVFEGIGQCGEPGLPPDQFQLVDVADTHCAPGRVAWIYVPATGG